MQPAKILTASLLDILFEGRNKEYGAYEIRNTYEKRMWMALAITLSVILLIGGGASSRGAPFFFQLSLPSPAHFVIFSPFLAVSQYFVVPLHKNNNKLQENGKDYIDGRPSYR